MYIIRMNVHYVLLYYIQYLDKYKQSINMHVYIYVHNYIKIIEMIESIYICVCTYFHVFLCVVYKFTITYVRVYIHTLIYAILNYLIIIHILSYILYIKCVSSLEK